MQRGQKYPLFIIFFLISLIIFLLDRSGILDPVFFPIRRALAPLQLLSSKVTDVAESAVSYVRFVRSGEERIKNLEQRNIELLLSSQELKDLRRENEDLRKQLGEDVSKTMTLYRARVLGVGRFLEFEVDQGDVIAPGLTVIYLNNFVGTVVKTGSGVGFVRLTTDPESKVPAKTNSASGVAVGEFLTGIIFEKISRGETVLPGDLVVTSGVGGQIPPNLALGKIKNVTGTKDELFQEATVEPLVDVRKLNTIFVVKR